MRDAVKQQSLEEAPTTSVSSLKTTPVGGDMHTRCVRVRRLALGFMLLPYGSSAREGSHLLKNDS